MTTYHSNQIVRYTGMWEKSGETQKRERDKISNRKLRKSMIIVCNILGNFSVPKSQMWCDCVLCMQCDVTVYYVCNVMWLGTMYAM